MTMKKFFVTMCAAFAMFAMVSCGGNPAISAAQDFLKNPTEETFKAVEEAENGLTEEQKAEYDKWAKEHAEELAGALLQGIANEMSE